MQWTHQIAHEVLGIKQHSFSWSSSLFPHVLPLVPFLRSVNFLTFLVHDSWLDFLSDRTSSHVICILKWNKSDLNLSLELSLLNFILSVSPKSYFLLRQDYVSCDTQTGLNRIIQLCTKGIYTKKKGSKSWKRSTRRNKMTERNCISNWFVASETSAQHSMQYKKKKWGHEKLVLNPLFTCLLSFDFPRRPSFIHFHCWFLCRRQMFPSMIWIFVTRSNRKITHRSQDRRRDITFQSLRVSPRKKIFNVMLHS